MSNSRHVHEHIKKQIDKALCGRSVLWLAEAAGVPQSTLARQMSHPKFSLDVLLKVAAALEEEVVFFLPGETPGSRSLPAERVLSDLKAVVRRWEGRNPTRNREMDKPKSAFG